MFSSAKKLRRALGALRAEAVSNQSADVLKDAEDLRGGGAEGTSPPRSNTGCLHNRSSPESRGRQLELISNFNGFSLKVAERKSAVRLMLTTFKIRNRMDRRVI